MRASTPMKIAACRPEPIIIARSQGFTLVIVLVVVLGRFLLEDQEMHGDEDDFQKSAP
jgi:hypothetical protein